MRTLGSRRPPLANHGNIRLQAQIHIRDARTLSHIERVFLYNLTTHYDFTEKSARNKVRARMGLSDHLFRRARESLLNRDLVYVVPNPVKQTWYRLDLDALKRLYDSTKHLQSNNTTSAATLATVDDYVVTQDHGVPSDNHVTSHHDVSDDQLPIDDSRQQKGERSEPTIGKVRRETPDHIVKRWVDADGKRHVSIQKRRRGQISADDAPPTAE